MSGHVGDLSPHQEEALKNLKLALRDIPDKPDDSDPYYLRWLRARKFDLAKTETMFRNHMEYRRKYGAATIVEDWQPSAVMDECIAGGLFGEDREGHPVWYDNFGNLDPRGLYRSIILDDVLKLKCLHAELLAKRCKEQSEKYGRLIDTLTLVMDFEKLSFQRHYYWPAIEFLKQVLVSEEANNPERVCRILIVKAPSIFPLCFNIVKHVLDERTRKKIIILGHSQSNWQEVLQQYISSDQLPAMYGGTRYEPDAQCSAYIHQGGDVPEKYYLSNQTEESKEDMERVIIGRGSSHKVKHEVAEEGSTIQWEFLSTDYDIAFEVCIKRGSEKEVVQAMSRTKSHLIPQSGYHKCVSPGCYILKFDNSYSWTRSKEVFYSIKVLPPNVTPEVHSDLPLMENGEENGQCVNGQEDDEFFECTEDGTNGVSDIKTSTDN